LCAHVVQILQSWLLFEQHEEQIKRKQELIVHARTFVEKYETNRISFFFFQNYVILFTEAWKFVN